MPRQYNFAALARMNPDAAICRATIRQQASDFQVEERLPFEPDGEGGHVFLNIEKTDINTDWLAQQLAKFAQVPAVDIGYAGLKDRHAVTRQWFSIKLEGRDEPDWSLFESDQIKILQRQRHNKKLKRGVLIGNQFHLVLTEIEGDTSVWQRNLEKIQQHGVPNYFAEQRFGHNMNNLYHVDKWFTGGRAPRKRNQRSLYISAARSWLFNLVLSERVAAHNWNQAISGDVMQLAGTRASFFVAELVDKILQERLASHDVHPTGPLYGKGNTIAMTECLALEQEIASDWRDWLEGMEKVGLKQERRALRLIPAQFNWQFIDADKLELDFFLPAGSYATAVLRELAQIVDACKGTPSMMMLSES